VVEGSLIPLPLSECIRRLRFLFPKGRFLAVDRPQPVEEISRLIHAGFHGFVAHANVSDCLASAVRAIAAGRLWISDEVMNQYVGLTTETPQPCGRRSALPTRREAEVLELVRRRMSNKEIATLLAVSESTVKYHISHILAKFRADNRRELEIAEVGPAQVWEQLSRTQPSRHSSEHQLKG
jgi:DNA-binding NarL/FixJ family response regulator